MDIETLTIQQGFLARPAGQTAPLPAVIVLQEWWGLNDPIKDIARRFASEGFVALAPDLYHGHITTDAGEAARLMDGLKTGDVMKQIEGVFHYLEEQPFVKKDAIGITGFSMGGSFALLAACRLKQLKAAVSFYGHYPEKPQEMAAIRCPVLFFAGGKDDWINKEAVATVEDAFRKYKLKGEVRVYPEADHAFFDDTRPEVYRRNAALDAWKLTLEFFRRHLS
jgi:carboxymethylenebutenolidase